MGGSAAHREQQWRTSVNGAVCLLQAARVEHESKARKQLAKLFWLSANMRARASSADGGGGWADELDEALAKYGLLVQPFNWLPWVPQLLRLLQRTNAAVYATLIYHVAQATKRR